jgi:hypothetical protein
MAGQPEVASGMPGVRAASYKANLDPVAVLKRVEDLRRWQEEERLKLLQAHEDQMHQLRLEQVSYVPAARKRRGVGWQSQVPFRYISSRFNCLVHVMLEVRDWHSCLFIICSQI